MALLIQITNVNITMLRKVEDLHSFLDNVPAV